MMPNSPIPPLPREALAPALQEAHDRAESLRGDTTFIDVMGHAPELFEWYSEFYRRVFYGGRVPVRIKELVRLRLSTVHGCAFCNRGNHSDAAAAGLNDTQLRSIGDETAACWSPAERAALRLAAAMALVAPRGHLDRALYAELRSYFDDAQIVELGVTMAVLTGMAKFLFVYDLVEKEDYCAFGAG
ncbi:MAG: carboxymuconolactone decarboxylase family protein [Gammaproteobacteria bacterium]|nr:carboxymuconolactone decarboxylase family protein [Gammaproteobacteria bacterium]